MSRQPHPLHAPRTLRLTIVLIGLVMALSAAAPLANAAPALEGSLTMTSDEGDYIGQGQTYSYDTSAGDTFGVTTTAGTVEGSIQSANGAFWHMRFAAPQGETLATGTYDGATRYPFQAPSDPGMDVFGDGRGCNTLTGSFTVTQVTFGSGGAVESFDADFEQHCEGAEPALRGHVHLVSQPPPPPLTLAIGLPKTGVADRTSGIATVSGTVTCSTPTTVWVSGTLTQRATRFAVATGQFYRTVECSGTTAWQATVSSSNSVPFNAGQAQLSVHAFGYDANWQPVTDTKAATIKLAR